MPLTVRLYGKKQPGRDATQNVTEQVKNTLNTQEFIECVAGNCENHQMSHQ